MITLLKNITVALFLFSPVISLAAIPGEPTPGGTPSTNSQQNLQVELVNPVKVDSIQELLQTILEIVIILATPIVVLFIIYAGFKYVTARGNASQIQEATQALTYAVIGGVLIIGAVAIAEIIKNLVNSFG
jgi:TRAP-type C4-dicarboxylate transport system permease small subunit